MKLANIDLRIEVTDRADEEWQEFLEAARTLEIESHLTDKEKRKGEKDINKKWEGEVLRDCRYEAVSKVWGRMNSMTFGTTPDDACNKLIDKLRKVRNDFNEVIDKFGLYRDGDQKFFDFPKTSETLSVVIGIEHQYRYTKKKGLVLMPNEAVRLSCAIKRYDKEKWDNFFEITDPTIFTKYIWHKKRGAEEHSKQTRLIWEE